MLIRDVKELNRWGKTISEVIGKGGIDVHLSDEVLAALVLVLADASTVLEQINKDAMQPMNMNNLKIMNDYVKTFNEDVNDLIVDLAKDVLSEDGTKLRGSTVEEIFSGSLKK